MFKTYKRTEITILDAVLITSRNIEEVAKAIGSKIWYGNEKEKGFPRFSISAGRSGYNQNLWAGHWLTREKRGKGWEYGAWNGRDDFLEEFEEITDTILLEQLNKIRG